MVGITTYVLQVLTGPVKIHVLVVAKPSLLLCNSQTPSGWDPDSPVIPMVQDLSRTSHKVTHNAGAGDGTGCPPLQVLFSH